MLKRDIKIAAFEIAAALLWKEANSPTDLTDNAIPAFVLNRTTRKKYERQISDALIELSEGLERRAARLKGDR